MAGRRSPFLRIFVRIGALKRFHTLKEKTKELPVLVSWDRRRGDRRAQTGQARPDQRKTERRGSAPFTWEVADFVVVEESDAPRD